MQPDLRDRPPMAQSPHDKLHQNHTGVGDMISSEASKLISKPSGV